MTRKHRIFVVDDEPNIGASLRLILEGEGYGVVVADSVRSFQAQRGLARADLYLLDVRLPDGNGIDLLRALRQSDDATPVVMISGHGTIRDAVDATQSGAFDFLEKPLGRDRVLLVTKNALERSDLLRENQRFRELVGSAPSMIGSSPAFQHAVEQATQVARSDVSVLLSGESGKNNTNYNKPGGYQNPDVEPLLTAIAHAPNPEAVQEEIAALQEMIFEDVPYIYLNWRNHRDAWREELQNFKISKLKNFQDFRTVWFKQ